MLRLLPSTVHTTSTCLPHATPPHPHTPTGLGFDDCSSTLQQLAPGGTPLPVPGQAPGTWAFFAVEVPATGAAHLHVAAAATEATQGGWVPGWAGGGGC
mgnify:CR=1 FL=1